MKNTGLTVPEARVMNGPGGSGKANYTDKEWDQAQFGTKKEDFSVVDPVSGKSTYVPAMTTTYRNMVSQARQEGAMSPSQAAAEAADRINADKERAQAKMQLKGNEKMTFEQAFNWIQKRRAEIAAEAAKPTADLVAALGAVLPPQGLVNSTIRFGGQLAAAPVPTPQVELRNFRKEEADAAAAELKRVQQEAANRAAYRAAHLTSPSTYKDQAEHPYTHGAPR